MLAKKALVSIALCHNRIGLRYPILGLALGKRLLDTLHTRNAVQLCEDEDHRLGEGVDKILQQTNASNRKEASLWYLRVEESGPYVKPMAEKFPNMGARRNDSLLWRKWQVAAQGPLHRPLGAFGLARDPERPNSDVTIISFPRASRLVVHGIHKVAGFFLTNTLGNSFPF